MEEKQHIFPIFVFLYLFRTWKRRQKYSQSFLYLRTYSGHGRGDRNIPNICVSVFMYWFRTWKRSLNYSQYLYFCIYVLIQDMEGETEIFPMSVLLYLCIDSGHGRGARGLGGTPGRGWHADQQNSGCRNNFCTLSVSVDQNVSPGIKFFLLIIKRSTKRIIFTQLYYKGCAITGCILT